MVLSLIIPIYNEESHLEKFLEKVDSLKFPIPHQLIFVDDASRDASAKILHEFSFKTVRRIFTHEKNCGKGAALRHGIKEAPPGIIAIQDADFEYDMDDLHSLVAPILANKADVVYGSRFSKSCPQVHRTFHYLVNRILTSASNLASGIYLSDMETCYKVFRSEIIQNINLDSRRFGFEPEITAKIARLNVAILELPVGYFPRNYIEGKKITWKDGIAALWHIIRYNFLASREGFFSINLPAQYRIRKSKWL